MPSLTWVITVHLSLFTLKKRSYAKATFIILSAHTFKLQFYLFLITLSKSWQNWLLSLKSPVSLHCYPTVTISPMESRAVLDADVLSSRLSVCVLWFWLCDVHIPKQILFLCPFPRTSLQTVFPSFGNSPISNPVLPCHFHHFDFSFFFLVSDNFFASTPNSSWFLTFMFQHHWFTILAWLLWPGTGAHTSQCANKANTDLTLGTSSDCNNSWVSPGPDPRRLA